MRTTPTAATIPAVDGEPLDDRYHRIRRITEALCTPLQAEDCVVQTMANVSPTKWHLAHTTWFFETFVLANVLPDYRVYHPKFRYLFNSYYNAVGEQFPRPERGWLTRPGIDEIRKYRGHVDEHVRELLATAAPTTLHTFTPLIELGLRHEQQHQELILTDIKHVFSCSPLDPVYRDRPVDEPIDASPARWHRYSGGMHRIGHDGTGFAYDNERPRHETYVRSFDLASRLVTNGEYRAFIDDGGYERPAHWFSDGWHAVQSNGWKAPLYWRNDGDRPTAMTLAGPRPINEAEPVCHVSYYEADAYARWAGVRLPTETEWEIAADTRPIEGNFVEVGRLHPAPTSSDTGAPSQMFGDVWEWTASPYIAYPGYRPPQDATGEYNAKFMCNQIVLRGGSCVTPRDSIRSTYRNFFQPDARWQFSGIRLARDLT